MTLFSRFALILLISFGVASVEAASVSADSKASKSPTVKAPKRKPASKKPEVTPDAKPDATQPTSAPDATSAAETLVAHYVSHAYLDKPNTDLTAIEVDAMTRFIDDTSIADSEKSIILIRYEVGDTRVQDALIKAKNKGFREVVLITDLNVALDGSFAANEKFNSNFTGSKFKSSNPGLVLQNLLKAGFVYNEGAYRILSQPLYSDKVYAPPIMHEKELLLATGALNNLQLRVGFFGTANMNGIERYNRLFRVGDKQTLKVLYDHSLILEEAYKKGLETKGAANFDLVKINYGDGSSQEIEFTDGRRNPNDRITALLQRATDPAQKLKITNVLFSHFVLTNKFVVGALNAAMKVQPDFKVQGVFDQSFISSDGAGLSSTLVGFTMLRSYMGKTSSVQPFEPALVSRMELFGYQRGVEHPENVPASQPQSMLHLWHDKTTVIDVVEDSHPWTYVFTGSFNNSAHAENAELQIMYRFPSDAAIVTDIKQSVMDAAKREPLFALPLNIAVMRDTLGRVFGRSDLDIPTDLVDKLTRTAKLGNGYSVQTLLASISQIPRTQKALQQQQSAAAEDKSAAPKVDRKLIPGQAARFVVWFAANVGNDKMSLAVLEHIVNALGKGDPVGINLAIDDILKAAGVDASKVEELKAAAYSATMTPSNPGVKKAS